VHGPPEAGKGFIAAALAAEFLRDGGRVTYLDFDQDPETVIERCRAAGSVDVMELHVHPIDTPLPIAITNRIRMLDELAASILAEMTSDLVVIDGVNAGMSMHGMSALSDQDYADFARLFAFRFRREGSTVLLCDHVPKAGTSGVKGAYGTVQKRVVLDGAVYEVRIVRQPAPGLDGALNLVVDKDRAGGVREYAERRGGEQIAATVRIDGRREPATVTFDLPATERESSFRPTFLMQRVSEYLEGLDAEGVSQRTVEADVKGKLPAIREALRVLVAEGYVARVDGPRGAFLHRSTRPYRESME
jgi:hypothetical protein